MPRSDGGTASTQETRELVVTVTARYPLAKIVDEYAEAISPDGGFTGTINAWIADNAKGLIAEMSPSWCEVEADWKLLPPDSESIHA